MGKVELTCERCGRTFRVSSYTWRVKCADALEGLRELDAESVDCVITSPPYWGLRDYGVDGQLGLEPHPLLYLEKLWAIFDEAQRVLKKTGVCWVNLGDTYFGGGDPTGKNAMVDIPRPAEDLSRARMACADGLWLRPKQKLLIPTRFAIGMQERGWLLRSDVIWHKPNAMPSSVKDRFSCTYEHVFLFSRSERYWFDLDAVREAFKYPDRVYNRADGHKCDEIENRNMKGLHDGRERYGDPALGKNPGDVWDICTQAFPESHFAVFPEALVKRMVRSGCPAQVCEECGKPWIREVGQPAVTKTDRTEAYAVASGMGRGRDQLFTRETRSRKTLGWQPTCSCSAATCPGLVLDPFCGSGTTGQVAVEEGRRFQGFELNPKYVEMSKRRIGGAQAPLPIADLQP